MKKPRVRGPRQFTFESLNEWIEQNFEVHVGPMRGYYGWDDSRKAAFNSDVDRLRGEYKVLACCTELESPFIGEVDTYTLHARLNDRFAERALVEAMFASLSQVHDRLMGHDGWHVIRPVLVLRRALQMTLFKTGGAFENPELPQPERLMAKMSIRLDFPEFLVAEESWHSPLIAHDGSPHEVDGEGELVDPPMIPVTPTEV